MRVAAAIVCLALVPLSAVAHELVDVQADLKQREPAVAFEPGIGSPFPDFHLEDPDGKRVDLGSLRGKVAVVEFISMRSADGAAQGELMAKIQGDVAAGHMQSQVRLLSVALDSERDTVATRKSYGPAHGLAEENWTFLAGATDEEAHRLAAELQRPPAGSATSANSITSGPVTYVVDSAGMLRARFFGLKFDPLNLVIYVNALTNDHHERDHETAAPAAAGPSWWQAVKRLL